jgi:hypothetical protein
MVDLSIVPIEFIESSEWINYFNSIYLPSENIGVLDRESLLERVSAFGFQQLHFKIAIFSASTHQVCVQSDTSVSCPRCSTTTIARLFSSSKPLNSLGSTISCHSGHAKFSCIWPVKVTTSKIACELNFLIPSPKILRNNVISTSVFSDLDAAIFVFSLADDPDVLQDLPRLIARTLPDSQRNNCLVLALAIGDARAGAVGAISVRELLEFERVWKVPVLRLHPHELHAPSAHPSDRLDAPDSPDVLLLRPSSLLAPTSDSPSSRLSQRCQLRNALCARLLARHPRTRHLLQSHD